MKFPTLPVVEKQASEIETQLQSLEITHRDAKRSQQVLEDLTQRVERRINEITEIQRLSEDRIRQEGLLPPGQALTFKFPVLHYGPVPHFNPSTWDFRVWGEVEAEKYWTWDEFNKLPRAKIEMDIHCVTRWSKFDTTWEGVSVRTMVENGLFKIKPTATHVMQHAEYGFTVNLPLEVVLQDNFLLATPPRTTTPPYIPTSNRRDADR